MKKLTEKNFCGLFYQAWAAFLGFVMMLSCTVPVWGQQATTKKITGTVIDAVGRSPLPFAHIRVNGYETGTVSNAQGEFLLHYPPTGRDTLYASFIGFASRAVVIDTSKKDIRILLFPQTVFLKSYDVYADRAEKLLAKALAKIPENHWTGAFMQQGFYREIVKDNQKAVQFTEAVLQMHRPEAGKWWKGERVTVRQGRNKQGLPPSPIWEHLRFINGPYEAVLCDFTRHPQRFIQIPQHARNFLDERHFRHYCYKLMATPDTYIIEFSPRTRGTHFSGQVYIHRGSLAFLGLYYRIPTNKLAYARLVPWNTDKYLQQQSIGTQPIHYECIVKYRPFAGKYALSMVHIQYSFMYMDRRRRRLRLVTNEQTLAVTGTNPDYKKPPILGAFQWQQALNEHIDKHQEVQWGDANVLPLTRAQQTLMEMRR